MRMRARGRVVPLIGLLCMMGARLAAQEEESCVTCHQALDDERLSRPVATFAADVHATKGLGCASCHGGDPQAFGPEAMDPAKGFVGHPARRETPQFCGRCHADAAFMRRYNPSLRVDQVAEFRTSVHGRRLAQFDDPRVATCVSCHLVHAIRPPTDPQSSVHPLKVAQTCGACHADSVRMAPYGIPTDQLRKYEASVHWEVMSVQHDLAAPTCNDCHGNHGAAPPGVSWVGNTCGQCHAVMQQLFDQSPHARVFPLMGVPGCAACHRNHDVQRAGDEFLGLDAEAICSSCHDAESPGGEQAVAMRRLIDSLRVDFDSADGALRRAERSGVEVSEGLFELQEARNALVGARTAVHAFNVDAVRAETEKGLAVTARAHERARRALRELRFRRTGLVISVAIIVALMVGVVLKIRQIESPFLSRGESP
jgi:predicted CXXCH cytochrome family protein